MNEDLNNKVEEPSKVSDDTSDEKTDKHQFFSYPFPKKLSVALKTGSYKLFSKNGESEIVEADNAKDAISKSKLTEVIKIHYLGFIDKLVFNTSEFTDNSGEQNDKT